MTEWVESNTPPETVYRPLRRQCKERKWDLNFFENTIYPFLLLRRPITIWVRELNSPHTVRIIINKYMYRYLLSGSTYRWRRWEQQEIRRMRLQGAPWQDQARLVRQTELSLGLSLLRNWSADAVARCCTASSQWLGWRSFVGRNAADSMRK